MRPILFKILLLICVYPSSSLAQQLSQAEHCIALEEKWNLKLNSRDTYVTFYLNHLQKCQPPIEQKFVFYKKILNWLLEQGPSPSILEQVNRVVQTLLDEIPKPKTESLQTLAHDNWETLSEKAQKNGIVFNISPSLNYHAEKPLSTQQAFQPLEGTILHAAEMTQKFSSQFSICKNTEEFQQLLRPLNAFLQNIIFLFSQHTNYEQLRSFQQLYTLYSSFYSQQQFHTSNYLHYISWLQLPFSFIEFLEEAIDWESPPFHNNYDWLKPLLFLLKMHIDVSEKIQSHCVPYQPFLNKEFVEHHYIAEFLEGQKISKEEKGRLLEIIQENLREQHGDFFFRSNISSENERMYSYFINLHSQPK